MAREKKLTDDKRDPRRRWEDKQRVLGRRYAGFWITPEERAMVKVLIDELRKPGSEIEQMCRGSEVVSPF